MPEPDKYDRAIAYLTEHPESVRLSWSGVDPRGLSLFQSVAPHEADFREDGKPVGCLTTIRRDYEIGAWRGGLPRVAWTDELTDAVRADTRIPTDAEAITPADLPVFAEWQRRIDKALNRVGERS